MGPGILVSGHDLRDLHELLEQTVGAGVNIYTHGEMLPANAYPALKKYDHLVGNYGGSWRRQGREFESFGGAILMTTNCLIPPRPSYSDRLFTTGVAAWPGALHIADRENGQPKDFGPVIAKALTSASPTAIEEGSITVGFAHETVLGVASALTAPRACDTLCAVSRDGRPPIKTWRPSGGSMTQVLTGLPVIVQISEAGRPVAFWWRNRRHPVAEVLCHWDDPCCISAHWLVSTAEGQRVTLIYDRSEGQWFVDWA